MGLIPRYIPTDFLDIISRIPISFGYTDMESAVLGVMYSLIAVVPLFEASHVIGLVGLFKQNKVFLWIVSIYLITPTNFRFRFFSFKIFYTKESFMLNNFFVVYHKCVRLLHQRFGLLDIFFGNCSFRKCFFTF